MKSRANSAALQPLKAQNSELSVALKPLFVASISDENPVDSDKLNFLVERLKNEVNSESGNSVRLIETGSSTRNIFSGQLWRRLTKKIYFLRTLTYALPRCTAFHLFHTTTTKFFTFTLPAIMIGRFFGKKIILHYLSETVELEFEKINDTYSAALKLCDKIVVSTRYAQAQLSGYDINADLVRLPVAAADRVKEFDYNLQPNIIMVRPFEKHSNLTCALKALKLVKMKYPRAEMTIIGNGSRQLYLERFMENNQILGVELLDSGATTLVNDLLYKADLYLNSSAADTLPYSMLQAMSQGMPVVSTDVGGISEVITNRQSGLLVRSNDHVAIADSIIELIENPELVEQLSKSGRKAAEKYSWENLSADWLSLLN